jgi:4-aminobutyrate aminotransferase/(S)-3-amino-2-methylpropionate transaminase
MTVQSPLQGGPGLAQVRRLVTEIPGPCSRELLARREATVARGVSHVLPVFISAAGGGVLIDVDGNSLIDFGSGIAVTSVGNSAPRVAAGIREQADRFTHTCFMVTPYEEYVAVCEELARRTPGDHDKRSALLNSGAEAVENAVKIARHATGRPAIVAFDHAYHGRTNLTMALTAKNMPYKDKFGPFAGEIYRMPMAYPLRWPGGPEACAANALDVITGLIHTQVGEDNVAAVLIEPIQGEGGFIVPPDGFLPGLAEFCREHGILLIADEIQTGFCRTGDWFASDHEPRGSPAGCRWPGSPGGPRSWTRSTWAVSAAPTAGTRWPVRRRSAPSRPWRPRTCRAGPAGSARSCCPGCTSWPRPTRSSATCGAAGR